MIGVRKNLYTISGIWPTVEAKCSGFVIQKVQKELYDSLSRIVWETVALIQNDAGRKK